MTNGWPAPASQNSVPMGRSDGLGTDEGDLTKGGMI